MTTAEDISVYLTEQGITASVNDIDNTTTDAIGVFDTGGFAPVRCHGSKAYQHPYDRPSFQILLRCANKLTASTRLDNITGVLDGIMNQTLNGHYYLKIEQNTSVSYLGRVETESGETNEYSVNYTSVKQR